jgi:diguanylate cyclase (GGDEF)-like protein
MYRPTTRTEGLVGAFHTSMADTDSTFAVTARRPRWFAVACTAGALWVIAYFAATRLVSPGGTSGTVLGDLVYPQTEVLATLMLLWAGTRASGSTRRFCFYMAASTFMGLCGDVTWAVLVLVVHSPPAPSVADVFYLGSVFAIFPALWTQLGSPLRRWRQTLDAAMVVLLVLYIASSFVLEPQIRAGLPPDTLVTFAETVLILGAGVWAIFAWLTADRRLEFGVRLVLGGIAIQAVSWLAYAYAVSLHGLADGSWLYTGWQASWAVTIAGATAMLLGIQRARAPRSWSSSAWIGTTVVTGLIVLTVADSAIVHEAPGRALAVLCGLGMLLARLHLTVRDRGRLAAKMHTLAETDVLTSVPNRRAFERRLAQAAADWTHEQVPVGLLVIDIDKFKVVNDGYGHPFGDRVLIEVTRRLGRCVRPSDMLARLGGEEFGALAHGVTGERLPALAERCRRAVAADPIVVDGVAVSITVSVGGACMPEHAAHSAELIRVADRALYEAKEAGRNRVHVGPRTTPQVEIPIADTGVLRSLEALADTYAVASGSHASGPAIVDVTHHLCRRLGVSVAERRRSLAAARLRDIGMIAVPPDILAKPGQLTPAELRTVRDHVRVGVELLRALPETRELAPIVGEHHERYDGTGYPLGLQGRRIALEARIIAVAEAWIEANDERGGPAARKEILRRAERQLDPDVVAALMSLLDDGTIDASGDARRRAA